MGVWSWIKRNAGGIGGGIGGFLIGGPAGAAIGSGLGSKTIDGKSWKNALVASGIGGTAGLGISAGAASGGSLAGMAGPAGTGGAASLSGAASGGSLAGMAGPAGTGGAASLSGAALGGSLAGMAGPAGTGGAAMLESTAPSFLSKISQYSPYSFGGSQILNAINQAGMAEDMNEAQAKSYEDYLSLINPPEEVKQARYNTLRNQVSTTATDARRRLRDTLASRGIRGRGIGGPNAALERSVMDANNNAFNQIYGTYNVPGEAPPVNYAPSTANILGKNISDIGTLLMMQNLYNNAQ